jgi:hypothetical protein
MTTEKPYRIRVKTLDGKSRERNKLRGQLVPHVDVIDTTQNGEFVICAQKEAHLDQVRAKLSSAGLEEIADGDTNVSRPVQADGNSHEYFYGGQPRSSGKVPLKPKPYGFVPLPENLTTAPPIWHDGTGTKGRLSGEIRFELTTLTPLLVGWERCKIDDTKLPWPIPYQASQGHELDEFLQRAAIQTYPDATDTDDRRRQKKQEEVNRNRHNYISKIRANVVEADINGVGKTINTKSVLCPLRAPWGMQTVLLPGDSLKGLLRHELGALLGAPMERVAERSYSYRPNSLFPKDPNPYLRSRLARIPEDGVEMKPLYPDPAAKIYVRVPSHLELLPLNLEYDKNGTLSSPRYQFDVPGAAIYRGGQGAGRKLNSKRRLHGTLEAEPAASDQTAFVPDLVQEGYLRTLRHLTDLEHGHFSERHPDEVTGQEARKRILEAATNEVFAPGDLIWVEWDTQKECIVSFGWHYYYRWAYVDTVRRKGWSQDRCGLVPLDTERQNDEEEKDAPQQLSAVRRLFGYTGDNDGSKGIGKNDYTQMMGRISVNAAVEVVADGERAEDRFLQPTFLRELGMPRPSAVEHYLEQPYHPHERPSDQATLATYGDAEGYDTPGKLAGRKFYLDRADAYTSKPWEDDSEANRLNDRSTLALEASRLNRRFRFTVRFRDLEPDELAVVIVALCPHQFRQFLGGEHVDGYCSKLGYARPLGWGSVQIEAKALLMLNSIGDASTLQDVGDLLAWMRDNYKPSSMLQQWLAIHRRKHPEAADYPQKDGQIYTYHTTLRAEHTRARRYKGSKR